MIKNKKEKTCILIDVATPVGRNIIQKEAENKLNNNILCVEVQRMCHMMCVVIPAIIEPPKE
jgi:hypothetical protein